MNTGRHKEENWKKNKKVEDEAQDAINKLQRR